MEILSATAVRQRRGRITGASCRPLRMLTFLAPNLFWFYKFISRYLATSLHLPVELSAGDNYTQLSEEADLAFVCGLPYVEHARLPLPRVEPLVAPVLKGRRYGGQPIYFSDVIVRRASPHRSFNDLRGRSWAYNERHSQSGYGITRYHLVSRGETNGYFGRVIEAGWHERAIEMVCSGEVDASAIDSHVLAVSLRRSPSLAAAVRIIDTLGPSAVQPLVVAQRLSRHLKEELRAVLLGMADDSRARPQLERALVERFVPVTDADYDGIRRMSAAADAAGFLTIR